MFEINLEKSRFFLYLRLDSGRMEESGMRDRKVVEQIADVIRLCEDTDGLLIANRDGIVEFQRVFVDNLWK